MEECQTHLDRYQESHADAAGNRLLKYERTIGRPLTKTCDAVTRVVTMMSCRLVVIHNCNPAIHDKRLRHLAERFPKVFTPMLKDQDEIVRRGLPSEIHFGQFVAWTAAGAPGFFEMFKTPAEFQSTLYAIPDHVTDGRLTEDAILHNLGAEIARADLEQAPEEQSLDPFPSLPLMNHAIMSREDSTVVQQFL